jgi:hypothetical protein
MDSISGAVSLARALLALSGSQQTGVLHVSSELGSSRLAVVRGVLRGASSMPGADDTLGDALLREGALDARAHERALRQSTRAWGPVGDWLVERGLSSRPAIEVALRGQLRDRVLRVLACRRIDYHFEAGPADLGTPWIAEPLATADLVLRAMRVRVEGWSSERLSSSIASGELRLNAVGHALSCGAALWPEEAVTVALLARGCTLTRVMHESRDALRALRLVAVLALLSAVRSEPARAPRFGLLLRKRQQLRRDVGARALLDLPDGAAPLEARRALRRLARRLHPDTLGPHASAALRASSSEVMGALIDAELELRVSAVVAE